MDEQKTLSERALEIALSQLGVTEVPKGSNNGPEVKKYLASVGLNPGYAWCMAFMYWCVDKAAKELGMKNPLIKTPGVLDQWNRTRCRKIPARATFIKPGDIFIMQFKHGTGHTGFIKKVEKGVVYTVEGNTNKDGSREGYAVLEKQRIIPDLKGIIQLQ